MSMRPNSSHDNFVYNNLSRNAEPNNFANNHNYSEENRNSNSIYDLNRSNTMIKSQIFSKSNICWLFIIISIICLLSFMLNLIFTINAFADNKVITMKPEIICNVFIKEHNDCLIKYRNMSEPQQTISECLSQSLNLQYCYDQVYYYNKKCYIYFSEFEKCVRDYKQTNSGMDYLRSKCKNISDDIQRCTADYMTIDPFVLLININ